MWLALQGFAQTVSGPAPYAREAAISQTASTIHIAANSPRPLEQTLDALRQKYGWVVDYEDPQYVSHSDFIEVPGDPSHNQVPSGGSFSVDFPAAAPDEEKTLRLILDAYNHSKNPGQFELRKNAQGAFFVVGTAAHDEKGAMAQQQAPFDLLVTIPNQERTITETINLICKALVQQNHTEITLGVNPRALIANTPVKVGGTKVPARELLLQSLAGVQRKTYWYLLFDPSSKGYYLDIHAIRPVKP